MDILFFAAIALFIFFKLREQLGKISDEEKNKISEKIKANQTKIIEIQKQIEAAVTQVDEQNKPSALSEKILSETSVNLQPQLIEILQKCNISAEFFINGVKSAFEMIIKAFAAKDLDTLKSLLSEKIYAGFEGEINKRNAAEKNLQSSIISIDKTEIISASIIDNNALITVKITSKQINYFTDKDGAVIEGRKDEITELSDVWTFKKDLTSPNPNWSVSTTG